MDIKILKEELKELQNVQEIVAGDINAKITQIINSINAKSVVLELTQPKIEVSHHIDINRDVFNIIEGIDGAWTTTLEDLSNYAFINVKSIEKNVIIYEKGCRRFMAKMKRDVSTVFDFFELNKFYIIKYDLKKRWGVVWAGKLDINEAQFIEKGKKLAGRCMHLKDL
jgi:hypothetical protein